MRYKNNEITTIAIHWRNECCLATVQILNGKKNNKLKVAQYRAKILDISDDYKEHIDKIINLEEECE